jgi:hypothetical protein
MPASPACQITSAYFGRLQLKSSLLMAQGAVGLCWCSEDRLGLEHHLVRLREHHGEHVHNGVPLLLCLHPRRCLLQPRRVTIPNGTRDEAGTSTAGDLTTRHVSWARPEPANRPDVQVFAYPSHNGRDP